MLNQIEKANKASKFSFNRGKWQNILVEIDVVGA